MMQRVLVAGVTIVLLIAGFLTGTWYEQRRPVPPPPAALMSELSGGTARPPSPADRTAPKPAINRRQLAAEIERLRPQLEQFRQRMDQLDQEFDRDFQKILTTEQLDKMHAWQKRRDEHNAKSEPHPATEPLTDDEIVKLQERPLNYMMSRVVISMRLEGFTHDLKLDEAQQSQTRELLRTRREKFISLIDAFPPPSLSLSRLAPLAQRLGTVDK